MVWRRVLDRKVQPPLPPSNPSLSASNHSQRLAGRFRAIRPTIVGYVYQTSNVLNNSCFKMAN